MSVLYVGLGGAFGAMARYLMSSVINKYWLGAFPLATLIINLIGCFCIGVLVALFSKYSDWSGDLKLFLITGFCGGFTTFSTFALEQWTLLESKMPWQSILYIVSSVILGLICLILGFAFVKFLNKLIY